MSNMVDREVVLGLAACWVAWTACACAEAELKFPPESGILAVSRSGGPPELTVVRDDEPRCGDQTAQVEINARTDVAWFVTPEDAVAAESIAESCSEGVVDCDSERDPCFPLVFEEAYAFDAGSWPTSDEPPDIRVPTACGTSFRVERTVELGLDSPPFAISRSGVIYASSGADVFRWDPPDYERSGPRRVSNATELTALSVDDDDRLWALSESALYRQSGDGIFDAAAFTVAEFDDVTTATASGIDVSAAFTLGAGRQLGVSSGYIVVGTERAIAFRVPATPDVDPEFNPPYRIRRIPNGVGVAGRDRVWTVVDGEQPVSAVGLAAGAQGRRFVARSGATVVGGHERGYRYREAAGGFSELVSVDLDGLVEVEIGEDSSFIATSKLDDSLLIRRAGRTGTTCVTRLPLVCDELDVESTLDRLVVSCHGGGGMSVVLVDRVEASGT
ncbi:MAG: hypothetical protein RMA76_13900 [Deltaproteobacteria bacterium]